MLHVPILNQTQCGPWNEEMFGIGIREPRLKTTQKIMNTKLFSGFRHDFFKFIYSLELLWRVRVGLGLGVNASKGGSFLWSHILKSCRSGPQTHPRVSNWCECCVFVKLTRVHVQGAVAGFVSVRREAFHGQLELLLLPAPQFPLLVWSDQGFHGKRVGSRAQSCGRSPPLTHVSQIHAWEEREGGGKESTTQRREQISAEKVNPECD